VIALFVAHNDRASSPKYLLGESYGGFRAVKVANALKESQGIIVSGTVMLSPLIEGQLMFGADQFALGAALEFPHWLPPKWIGARLSTRRVNARRNASRSATI
jgi:carboxypeptidase C (cathepsin A)